MLIITTGRTPDRTPTVFTDIFKVAYRERLPIDLLVKKVIDDGYVIDWDAEIEGALKLGITQETILKGLGTAYKYLYPDLHLYYLEKAKWYLRLRPKKVGNPDHTIKTYINDSKSSASGNT